MGADSQEGLTRSREDAAGMVEPRPHVVKEIADQPSEIGFAGAGRIE